MKDVVIVGTGGHAKVVADIVIQSGDNLIGFLTSDQNKRSLIGKPVLGDVPDWQRYKNCYFIVAIGKTEDRERVVEFMQGAKWYTAVHTSSIISNVNTSIGNGTVVMANAVINPFSKVGNHCIINTGAIVEHDNTIGDFSHVSVGVKLAGEVRIGERTCVGIGAVVSNKVNICSDCIIGAGAVVVKNIEASGTYVGVPVRRIK